MDLLIEIILELILEGTLAITSNKKVPKWIRYPLIFILSILLSIVIIGLFILGVYIYQENIIISLIFILSSTALLIGAIIKFKNQYLEKKESKNDNHN